MKVRFAGNALLISALMLICLATAHAQSQLVPLITDKTPLDLPDNFAIPSSSVLNQSGAYAFITGVRQSALFLVRSGESSPTLVMQAGDELPGFPGSRVMMFSGLSLNNSGLLAFMADTALAAGETIAVIMTFDGTSFQKIVAGNDVAPDTGGRRFGRGPILIGMNDSGDVAFTAGLYFYPFSPTNTAQTTLFISPGGGAPVRLIGVGDAAPEMGQGETLATMSSSRLNNRGEILLSAGIQGGSGGSGLFIASTAGNRKVIANGDPNPSGGFFSLPSVAGLLNNAGQVAFAAAGAIWINSPGTGNSKALPGGVSVPIPPGGTIGTQLSLQAFSDDSTMAFTAYINNPTGRALFRLRPGWPLEVVVYRNQAALGAEPSTFYDFSEISINAGGAIGFRATLQGGSIPIGLYRQAGADAPAPVVLDGEPTTLAGGGKYSLASSTRARILDSEGVFFRADVFDGEADGGEFLVSGSDTRVLMHTAEILPDDARPNLWNWILSAAGNHIGFSAYRNGGGPILAIHNITTHTTSVIATQGDVIPGIGRIRLNNQNHFINTGGNLVFSATTVAQSPGWVIISASPGTGLKKIVATGDADSDGRTFRFGSIGWGKPAQFNSAGQVVFSGSMSGVGPESMSAKRVKSPSRSHSAETPAPGGGSFYVFRSRAINQAGQVAFLADIGPGTGSTPAPQGIYVYTPGIGLEKIAATGDPGPAGTTFAGFDIPDFNNLGEVAFEATLTGGVPRGGVFVASSPASLTAVVLDGESAPAGGNFSIPIVNPLSTYHRSQARRPDQRPS